MSSKDDDNTSADDEAGTSAGWDTKADTDSKLMVFDVTEVGAGIPASTTTSGIDALEAELGNV